MAKLSKEDIEKIYELHEQGYSGYDIAKKMQIPHQQVYYYLKKKKKQKVVEEPTVIEEKPVENEAENFQELEVDTPPKVKKKKKKVKKEEIEDVEEDTIWVLRI